MSKFKPLLLAMFVIAGTTQFAAAQSTATQNVTIVVAAIDVISVSAGTLTITINSATPGSAPDATNDATSTWALTTNNSTTTKITGSLGATYAAGISLDVNLQAPTSSGVSAGAVTLTTTDQDLVTGMSAQNEAGRTITYTASATTAVAPNGGGEVQTVTFTITT